MYFVKEHILQLYLNSNKQWDARVPCSPNFLQIIMGVSCHTPGFRKALSRHLSDATVRTQISNNEFVFVKLRFFGSAFCTIFIDSVVGVFFIKSGMISLPSISAFRLWFEKSPSSLQGISCLKLKTSFHVKYPGIYLASAEIQRKS